MFFLSAVEDIFHYEDDETDDDLNQIKNYLMKEDCPDDSVSTSSEEYDTNLYLSYEDNDKKLMKKAVKTQEQFENLKKEVSGQLYSKSKSSTKIKSIGKLWSHHAILCLLDEYKSCMKKSLEVTYGIYSKIAEKLKATGLVHFTLI